MRRQLLFFLKRSACFVLCLCALTVALFLPGPSVAAEHAPLRLTLAQAISLALEHNEDIRESFRRLSAAEASVMSSKGAYDLNVFSSSRYGRFNSLSSADYPGSNVSNAAESYNRVDTGIRQRVPTGASLSAYYTYTNERMLGMYGQPRKAHKNYLTIELAQSLLKGIGDKEYRGAIENALLAVEESEEGKSLIVSQVTLEVIRSYWMLDVAHYNIAVSERILEMAQEVLRREEVRHRQGLSQGVDVERARMAVKQREYTLLQFERDLAVAQERFALLLNNPDYESGMNIVPASPLNTTVGKIPGEQDSFTSALNKRYELKQLAILLKQLDIEYDINSNKLLPSLDLNVGFTTSNGNDYLRSAENFKDTSEEPSWFVGVTFSYPLQNREARGRLDNTKQLIGIAEGRMSKARRSVETEVREALHNLVLARDGIPVAQAALEAAQSTLNGETKRFEMGQVNNRDLLASHDSLGREDIILHTSIVNYNIALAEYYYACALLLDKYQIVVDKENAYLR